MKKTRNALAAVTVASLTLSSLMLAVPAQALELDVRDASFDFANPLDANILADASVGDSYFYTNVATVEGSQIDALVTFVAASTTSVGASQYEEFDQAEIDALNVVDANAVDVPGCYSNAAYIAAMEGGNPYAETDFVAADFLAGESVQYLDEFEGDPAVDPAINTNTDLCTFDGSVDGFVTIRVDFQVGGSPVTLNNLAIFAGDIDSLQSVTLFEPVPTATYVSPTTQLTVTEVPGVSVEFKSPDISSDETDPDAADFVAEAQYSGVSSVTYTFGLEDAGGGSLSMLFDSFFNPTLPDTGVDVTSGVVVGGSLLVLGAAVVLIMRRRRQSV
jgi:LPXTG-motif cell wall-anchored protein